MKCLINRNLGLIYFSSEYVLYTVIFIFIYLWAGLKIWYILANYFCVENNSSIVIEIIFLLCKYVPIFIIY